MELFRKDLNRVLKAERIPCRYYIQSRIKHADKIKSKQRMVNDHLGVRVVYFPPGQHHIAYEICRVVSQKFQGVLVCDYILQPKEHTRYQSLHMHVEYFNNTIELQIRDTEMHNRAYKDSYHS